METPATPTIDGIAFPPQAFALVFDECRRNTKGVFGAPTVYGGLPRTVKLHGDTWSVAKVTHGGKPQIMLSVVRGAYKATEAMTRQHSLEMQLGTTVQQLRSARLELAAKQPADQARRLRSKENDLVAKETRLLGEIEKAKADKALSTTEKWLLPLDLSTLRVVSCHS